MSIYEASITNPKKQLEFYKDLSEQLQQENQQLKESYCNRTDCSGRLYDSRKYSSVKQQLDKYKSVLDEIREFIDKFPCIHYASAEKVDGKRLSGKLIPTDDLLQILDKVKENDNKE